MYTEDRGSVPHRLQSKTSTKFPYHVSFRTEVQINLEVKKDGQHEVQGSDCSVSHWNIALQKIPNLKKNSNK